MTDYWPSYKRAFEPLDEKEYGKSAYRKLVEMGFDAVPALLEHIDDERFTRYTHTIWNVQLGPVGYSRVQVRNVVGQLLNDLSGREFSDQAHPQLVDDEKARAWWEKARKEGEEKWLVAHAVPESAGYRNANDVIFRALGAKYPTRLGEFYRTVLAKYPHHGSSVLADEVTASKLPRAEKLALLVEGAEHKSLVHRNAALAALARLDPPLFRKHLVATFKKLPPNDLRRFRSAPQVELAVLVLETDDPVCWDTLAEVVKGWDSDIRFGIVEKFQWKIPDGNNPTRREAIRFLLRFLSDESVFNPYGPDGEKIYARSVQDVAISVLASHLKFEAGIYSQYGPFSRVFLRAAVTKAAMEELARLKK